MRSKAIFQTTSRTMWISICMLLICEIATVLALPNWHVNRLKQTSASKADRRTSASHAKAEQRRSSGRKLSTHNGDQKPNPASSEQVRLAGSVWKQSPFQSRPFDELLAGRSSETPTLQSDRQIGTRTAAVQRVQSDFNPVSLSADMHNAQGERFDSSDHLGQATRHRELPVRTASIPANRESTLEASLLTLQQRIDAIDQRSILEPGPVVSSPPTRPASQFTTNIVVQEGSAIFVGGASTEQVKAILDGMSMQKSASGSRPVIGRTTKLKDGSEVIVVMPDEEAADGSASDTDTDTNTGSPSTGIENQNSRTSEDTAESDTNTSEPDSRLSTDPLKQEIDQDRGVDADSENQKSAAETSDAASQPGDAMTSDDRISFSHLHLGRARFFYEHWHLGRAEFHAGEAIRIDSSNEDARSLLKQIEMSRVWREQNSLPLWDQRNCEPSDVIDSGVFHVQESEAPAYPEIVVPSVGGFESTIETVFPN